VVNLSLLMKWRWRLLNNDDVGLWNAVLVAKYGTLITQNASWTWFKLLFGISLVERHS
jgi:hypothetical protein